MGDDIIRERVVVTILVIVLVAITFILIGIKKCNIVTRMYININPKIKVSPKFILSLAKNCCLKK